MPINCPFSAIMEAMSENSLAAQIVPIAPALVDAYRKIRLEALRTDPSAFGSTYDRELRLTPDDWNARTLSLDGINRLGLLALQAGEPCGLVACFRDEKDGSLGHIISMWIAPAARRHGLASALLESVRTWAQAHAIVTLQLQVTNINSAAIELYRRAGFTETGRTEPYPNDPNLFEIEMTRPTRQA